MEQLGKESETLDFLLPRFYTHSRKLTSSRQNEACRKINTLPSLSQISQNQ